VLTVNKNATSRLSAAETVKWLNALDARRRAIAMAHQSSTPE
jgi:hypothetical protein